MVLKKIGKNVAGVVKYLVKMRLKNKVAIVTGGTSGIGLAVAKRFSEEGAKVVIVGRNKKKGEKVASKLKNVIFYQADVSVEKDIEDLMKFTYKKYGKIDVLHNNAGIEFSGTVLDTKEEDWERVQNINLKGVFFGCKHVIPYMLKKGKGSIVNTASVAGKVGFPNLAAYCASKGGVVLLTKEVALDFAEKGIRCNAVCPGAIHTPMLEGFFKKAPNPKKAKHDMANSHPMKRLGKPEEIANAVLYLASDESSFVTGHALVADGGLSSQ